MRDDPDYSAYLRQWAAIYEGKNYDEGLAGWFLSRSHKWCESTFGPRAVFSRVLEVGAGTGVHLSYVRHQFDEYVMTDLNAPLLDHARAKVVGQGKIVTRSEDATRLSFEGAEFDRVIATHVLEHLPEPHRVLREWMRVLKPGGVLSLVLPCDPGVAWRLGRALGARGKFVRAGMDYDYWMAREHINAINNLVSLIRFYFPTRREERWLPLRIPSMDANLFYVAHIRKVSV